MFFIINWLHIEWGIAGRSIVADRPVMEEQLALEAPMFLSTAELSFAKVTQSIAAHRDASVALML